MIIEAFLEWLETARTQDRIRAARALGAAWSRPELQGRERQAVRTAMTCLLDDPSPQVRLALAQTLAPCPQTPREIALSLVHDQPEIAFCLIKDSPVLTDHDLVDLVAGGDSHAGALVAARPGLSAGVAAALAEVGDMTEIMVLLENRSAILSRSTLIRIAERHGGCVEVRQLLIDRTDLPSEARHLLVEWVGEALAAFGLVQATMGKRRIERVKREASETAIVEMAARSNPRDLPALVEHLRDRGRLTPAFLIQALCRGRVDFFAAAITNLSGLPEKRVTSLIGDGRFHAIRALYEAAGLPRSISVVFVDATLLWRQAQDRLATFREESIFSLLQQKHGTASSRVGAVGELLDMVERLEVAERRQAARLYSQSTGLVAA